MTVCLCVCLEIILLCHNVFSSSTLHDIRVPVNIGQHKHTFTCTRMYTVSNILLHTCVWAHTYKRAHAHKHVQRERDARMEVGCISAYSNAWMYLCLQSWIHIYIWDKHMVVQCTDTHIERERRTHTYRIHSQSCVSFHVLGIVRHYACLSTKSHHSGFSPLKKRPELRFEILCALLYKAKTHTRTDVN